MKIREFILAIIFVIFPQKWHFRLTNEILEIAQNLAYAKRFGGGREISEMKRFLNFWVLHSPNSIFHGCTYSFVLNFDWLIEVEFEPLGTDSRAEVILEQSFWSEERRSWWWIKMRRFWRFDTDGAPSAETWSDRYLKSSSPAQKKMIFAQKIAKDTIKIPQVRVWWRQDKTIYWFATARYQGRDPRTETG